MTPLEMDLARLSSRRYDRTSDARYTVTKNRGIISYGILYRELEILSKLGHVSEFSPVVNVRSAYFSTFLRCRISYRKERRLCIYISEYSALIAN